LYLSEVGSLPLFLQERLDRILAQASSGDLESVRVLTGSKDPLDDMATKGNFMPTLHQRLKTFTMKIDPLRERTEDILSLAHYFLRQRGDGSDSESIGIEKDAELALSHYAWLGNVDELREALEEAKKSAGDRMIGVEDLPQRLRNNVDLEGVKKRKQAELEQYKGKAMKAFLRDKEKEYLQLVLNSVQDDKEEAAKKLNLDAQGLERHISGDGA
jgi:DNA-binding NtrC family response regulator